MTVSVVEAFNGSVSVGTTEYSMPNASTVLTPRTDEGCFQPFVDTSAIAKGDQFQIHVYEKVLSAGAQFRAYSTILTGPMAELWSCPALMLKNGWDMTIKKLAGTDRTLSWSIRRVGSAVTEESTGTHTFSTSEYSLLNAGGGPGGHNSVESVYQPFIDLSLMSFADRYRIAISTRARTADSHRVLYEPIIPGPMMDMWIGPAIMVYQPWDITVQKLAGVDRSISWSIRYM